MGNQTTMGTQEAGATAQGNKYPPLEVINKATLVNKTFQINGEGCRKIRTKFGETLYVCTSFENAQIGFFASSIIEQQIDKMAKEQAGLSGDFTLEFATSKSSARAYLTIKRV